VNKEETGIDLIYLWWLV